MIKFIQILKPFTTQNQKLWGATSSNMSSINSDRVWIFYVWNPYVNFISTRRRENSLASPFCKLPPKSIAERRAPAAKPYRGPRSPSVSRSLFPLSSLLQPPPPPCLSPHCPLLPASPPSSHEQTLRTNNLPFHRICELVGVWVCVPRQTPRACCCSSWSLHDHALLLLPLLCSIW